MTITIVDGQTTSVENPAGDIVEVAAGVTQTITSGDNINLENNTNDGTVINNAGTLINLDTTDEDVVVFVDNSEDDVIINNLATGVMQGANGVIFAEGDGIVINNDGLIEGTGDAQEGVIYFDRDADSAVQTLNNTGTITGISGPTIGFDSLLGNDPSSGTVGDETGISNFVLNNSGTISNTGIDDSDSDAINLNGDPGTTGGVARGSLEGAQVNSVINLDVTNTGTISTARDNGSNAGIRSEDDAVITGTIDNQAGGTIIGANRGITINGAHADHDLVIDNAGDIEGTSNDGILISGAGVTINNLAGGTITGGDAGIEVAGTTIDIDIGATDMVDVAIAAISNTFTNAGTIIGGNASFDATDAGEGILFTQMGGVLTGDFLGTSAFDDSFVVGTGAFTLTDDILQTVDVTVNADGSLTLDGDGARTIDGDLTSNGTVTVDLADTHLLAGDLDLAAGSTLVVTDTTGLAASAVNGDLFTLIDVAGLGAEAVTLDVSALTGAAGTTFELGTNAAGDLVLTTVGPIPGVTENGDASNNLIQGGAGNDVINGGLGNDRLFGLDGDDTLNGEGDNDFLSAGAGDDMLNGGLGADTLFGSTGEDTLAGGDGDDVLLGGTDNDSLNGDAGNDQLRGQAGDDVLDGGAGNDLLSGATGVDTLDGGAGNDNIYGGASNDTLNGGDDNDRLYGDAGDDILNGDAGDDVLVGGAGNDTLLGGAGNDTLYAATGEDILDGGIGNDRLYGGDLDDNLVGGAGDDVMRGDGGADVLNGGTGDDFLVGGAGADLFVFGAADGVDRIFDFDVASEVIEINGSTFTSFADVQAAMTDGATFVTIEISAGNTIRLDGVQAADLTAANFDIVAPAVKPSAQDDSFLDASFGADAMLELLGTIELASTAMTDQGFLELIAEDGLGYEDGGAFL